MYHAYAIIIILLLLYLINLHRVIAGNTKKIGEILIKMDKYK